MAHPAVNQLGVDGAALPATADHANVSGPGAQSLVKHFHVVQVAAGGDHQVAVAVELDAVEAVGKSRQDPDLVGLGKPVPGSELRPVVHYRHPKSDPRRSFGGACRNMPGANQIYRAAGLERVQQKGLVLMLDQGSRWRGRPGPQDHGQQRLGHICAAYPTLVIDHEPRCSVLTTGYPGDQGGTATRSHCGQQQAKEGAVVGIGGDMLQNKFHFAAADHAGRRRIAVRQVKGAAQGASGSKNGCGFPHSRSLHRAAADGTHDTAVPPHNHPGAGLARCRSRMTDGGREDEILAGIDSCAQLFEHFFHDALCLWLSLTTCSHCEQTDREKIAPEAVKPGPIGSERHSRVRQLMRSAMWHN